jgi:hypothetical protein
VTSSVRCPRPDACARRAAPAVPWSTAPRRSCSASASRAPDSCARLPRPARCGPAPDEPAELRRAVDGARPLPRASSPCGPALIPHRRWMASCCMGPTTTVRTLRRVLGKYLSLSASKERSSSRRCTPAGGGAPRAGRSGWRVWRGTRCPSSLRAPGDLGEVELGGLSEGRGEDSAPAPDVPRSMTLGSGGRLRRPMLAQPADHTGVATDRRPAIRTPGCWWSTVIEQGVPRAGAVELRVHRLGSDE